MADPFEAEDRVSNAGIFDVAIAGAGPAGSIAARHLAQAGRHVLMLDRLRPTTPKLGETLPGAARRLLMREGLGALVSADPFHAPVCGGLVVWGDDQPQVTDALRDPYGPGLRLDRGRFDLALRQASLSAGSQWSPTEVRHLERNSDHWLIHRDTGAPVRARMIIDATGRAARLLRLLRQPRDRGPPLVALYQIARPEKNATMERTLIEARPGGWSNDGKLSDNSWAIGYHTQPQDAVRLHKHAAERALTITHAPHLATYLGALSWQGPVISRDARSLAAATPCGPGWFAVGDAALAFDPIAGQGLFNALRTGLAAAKAILTDPVAGAASYAAELARVTAIYLDRRQALYTAEMRWSAQAFWRNQRAPAQGLSQKTALTG